MYIYIYIYVYVYRTTACIVTHHICILFFSALDLVPPGIVKLVSLIFVIIVASHGILHFIQIMNCSKLIQN